MGCFDAVEVPCCECNTPVEFQSKRGDCSLTTYKIDSVPIRIAEDLNGTSEKCSECGSLVTLSVPSLCETVAMMATPF